MHKRVFASPPPPPFPLMRQRHIRKQDIISKIRYCCTLRSQVKTTQLKGNALTVATDDSQRVRVCAAHGCHSWLSKWLRERPRLLSDRSDVHHVIGRTQCIFAARVAGRARRPQRRLRRGGGTVALADALGAAAGSMAGYGVLPAFLPSKPRTAEIVPPPQWGWSSPGR